MTDLDLAMQFIRTNVTPIELRRAQLLINGEPPDQETIEALTSDQRPDGGWTPFWADDYSSLDATCFRLAQIEQIGLNIEHPRLQAARHFLENRQAGDGSWQEDLSAQGLAPFWASPGEPKATIYLTANCGYWLARLQPGSPGALKAARYLSERQNHPGHLPSYLHAAWMAAGLWKLVGMEAQAESALDFLSTRLDELSGSGMAWMLTTLIQSGWDTRDKRLQVALDRLEACQDPTGRWKSEDGAQFDGEATLAVLFTLHLSQRI